MSRSPHSRIPALLVATVVAAASLVAMAPSASAAKTQLKAKWGTSIDVSRGQFSRAGIVDVAARSDRGAYVVGQVGGIGQFGSETVRGPGIVGVNQFLARLDSKGKWLWAITTAGGQNFNQSVATAPDGGAYVCSITWADLQGDPLPAAYAFIAKYSAGGVEEWISVASASKFGGCSDMAVAPDGSVYVTGDDWYPATGPYTGTALVAKIGDDGAWQWFHRMGGSRAQGHGIAVLPDGRIATTGLFKVEGTFGSRTLTDESTDGSPSPGAVFYGNSYVAILNADTGDIESVDQISSPNLVWASAIATTRSGGIAVTGSYREEMAVGNRTAGAPTSSDSRGFIAYRTGAGSWAWIETNGEVNGGGALRDVVETGDGRLVAGGDFGIDKNGFIALSSAGQVLKKAVWNKGEGDISALSATRGSGFIAAGTLYGDWQLSKKVRIPDSGDAGTGFVARFK